MSPGRENPYVGLDYFGEDDAEVFFGRDAERRRIIGNLRTSRLTLLYAQSGVGKSSLLRAGVAARLRTLGQRAAGQRGSPRYVPVVFSAWRHDPIGALVTEIAASARPFLTGGDDLALPVDSLDDALRIAADALDATPLVILDQFEEFFLYHEHDEAGQCFADALARCLDRPDVRAHFLISIREDSYSRIGDHFKDRIPNVYANYLHLDYLDERAARDAIRKPLTWLAAGANEGNEPTGIEDELVDEVLRQVRHRPAIGAGENGSAQHRAFETAYLQLVMERLWADEKRQGSDVLRLATMTRLGGAQTIISSHLDDAVNELGPGERDGAAAAFRFLVTSSGSKRALTASELTEFTSQPESLLTAVLERLREERILRPVALDGNRSGYELFHDMLGEAVVGWRKRHEAQRHRQALQVQHDEQERRKLAQAAAQHAAQRAALVRRAAAALSLLVVILAGAVVWAVAERRAAQQAREQARSGELAASAVTHLAIDPERSVLLARKAWTTAPTATADAALRRSLSESHLRDRFGVGAPSDARLSTYGESLVTGDSTSLSVWHPEARGHGRGRAQRSAVDPRLAFRHEGRNVLVMAVAATGAAAAFGSGHSTRVVRTRKGAAPVTLKGLTGAGSSIALSADGRHAAGFDPNGDAGIWNTSTGAREPTPGGNPAYPSPYVDLAFDPSDPERVFMADCAGRLTAWRWRRGASRRLTAPAISRRTTDPYASCLLAVSPDGTRAAQTLHSGSAVLWNLDRARPVTTRLGDAHAVADLAFSPDGLRVVSASRNTATVFDAQTGRQISRLAGHTDAVRTVAFSPTGDRVLTSSGDGTARAWDVATGALLVSLRGHREGVLDAAFMRSGDDVLTVSSDGTARRWSIAMGRVLRGHGDWVRDVALAPGGKRAAAVDVQGRLVVHELNADGSDTRRRPPRRLPIQRLNSVGYDRSGERIVVAGDDLTSASGRVLVVDARTLKTQHDFLSGLSARSAGLSPDGRWALAATYGRPELWRLRGDRPAGDTSSELPAPATAFTVDAAFSSDGRWIVTAGSDNVARVFATSTRRPRRRSARGGGRGLPVTHAHRGISGVRFSPDGLTVMSFGSDATVHLWDASTGRLRHILRGHTAIISSGAFSPDGRRIVTGGGDQTTRVWEVASGRLLSTQRMHGDYVNSVSFAADNATIVSASDDRTVRMYPCATCASTEDLFALSRGRVFFGRR